MRDRWGSFALLALLVGAARPSLAQEGSEGRPGAGPSEPPAEVSTATSTSAGAILGIDDLDESPPAADTRDLEARDDARAGATVVQEIEVSAERVAEAAKPDTQVRLTGRQLIERGVTNLAEALDMIADTPIRSAGRGGFQTDIRGARKGGVLMLLDGVPIGDPYLGNFDVSSIPTTDIAEIRVSMTPASPLDGPAGNGGVIEILTRPASGPSSVRAGVQASDAPGTVGAVTGRATVGSVGVRVSGQATYDNRNYAFVGGDTPEAGREDARGGNAGLRLDRLFEHGRLSLDLGAGRRSFVAAPSNQYDDSDLASTALDVLFIRRQDLFRGVAGGEFRSGAALVSGRVYSLVLDQDNEHYHDLKRTDLWRVEHVLAQRSGASAQVDYHVNADLRLTLAGHAWIEGGHQDANNLQNGAPILPTSDGGVAPIVLPAAGLTWVASRWLTVDASGGAAVPIGLSAAPWPEGKVTVTVTPTSAVQLRLTGAEKGRLPSIRDRFDGLSGNKAVGPEKSSALEGGVLFKPRRWVSFDVGGYYRRINGLIRLGQVAGMPGLFSTNVGDAEIAGVETRVDAAPFKTLSFGAAYAYAHQRYIDGAPRGAAGQAPLDFFPAHRGEVSAAFRGEDAYGLWGRVRYVGDRLDKGTSLSPFVTVDAAAWTKIDAVRVTLRAENLLDQSYEVHAGVPGFGRTLFVGLEGVLE